ncbi:MAG: UbiH/UbiF/VisC/COQ6 family ubiquinone biosynthesis hydroxylase, partial [Caulobacteraceae bacterium]
ARASAGMAVAIVDTQPLDALIAPAFDGRASAIAYANFRQWRALGVENALAAEAQPINSILVTDGPAPGASAGSPLPVFLHFDSAEIADTTTPDGDEPLGWMLENRHIRAVLNGALERAGVAVFAPATVERLDTTGARASVHLADGRTLQAPIFVGADGRASRVRQAAGIGVSGWTYAQAGVVATVALEQPHDGVAHQYFLPGGPLAILPLTGDRASLVWTEKASRADALAQGSPQAFEAYLARRFGEMLGRARLLGPRFTYPLKLQMAESLTAPRIALIGDAAHAVHPLAGQGLNMGLKDVAALAEVLVDARRIGEDFGGPLALERYARWRRFDAASLAMTTDLMSRLFSNDHPSVRAARGAGMALVNRIAPARRLFMQDSGANLGDLPRLLRGEAL